MKYLDPEEKDMTIVLTECGCDTDDEGEIKSYVDVSDRKKVKDKNSLDESYAIEFV